MLLFSCFLCSCSQALTGQSDTELTRIKLACPHRCFSRSSCGVLVAEPTVCTCESYASELCVYAKAPLKECQVCLVSSFLFPLVMLLFLLSSLRLHTPNCLCAHSTVSTFMEKQRESSCRAKRKQ
ncbi:hypothetical protein GQ54DRAFT_100365 [Martensiomyces pterosporus]|nr:hypothetical protein GQ54DRAFT_100365 [Martensiomyces pterosporus]